MMYFSPFNFFLHFPHKFIFHLFLIILPPRNNSILRNIYPWVILERRWLVLERQFRPGTSALTSTLCPRSHLIQVDYRDRRVERQRRWPEALFRRLATLNLFNSDPLEIDPLGMRNLQHSSSISIVQTHGFQLF